VDDAFDIFLERFGGITDPVKVPGSSIEHYKGKLPNRWLEYWAKHGWCGFGDGLFWIVNPQDYEPVVQSWLAGTALEASDTYHLIARSAFGDLYLWGEKTGACVTIVSVYARYDIDDPGIADEQMDEEAEVFLLSQEVEDNDFENMFRRAREKFGALKHDEMYGFVPALMLGGSEKFDNLEKVKAVEHLMILSQLAELEPYNFPDLQGGIDSHFL